MVLNLLIDFSRNAYKHFKFVGLVKDNKADFAVAPFGWRKDRLEVVDWLPMNAPSVAQIYIKNPKDSLDWHAYIKPLRTNAWIGGLLFLAILPIIMVPVIFDCK